MLASDIRFVMKAIISDYKEYDLISALNSTISLLQQRPVMSDQKYNAQVDDVLKGISGIDSESKYGSISFMMKKFVEDSQFSHLTPQRVVRFIRSNLQGARSSVVPSAEANAYLEQANATLAELSTYVSVSDKIGVDDYEIDNDEVLLRLDIPRDVFNNDLDTLGHKIENFDRFFAAISEFVSGPNTKPRIVSVSTSNFVAILVAHADEIVAISKIFGGLIDVVKRKIELVSALKTMKSSGVSAESLKGVEEAFEATSDKLADNKVREVLAELDSEKLVGRRAELGIAISKSANYLIEDVANGTRLTIQFESNTQIKLLTENKFGLNEDDLVAMIDRQNNEQDIIQQMLTRDTSLKIKSNAEKN